MRFRAIAFIACLAALLLAARVSAQGSSPIQHTVVLMMENRSFDHLLGWLMSEMPEIDGLTGNEFNFVNASDPTSQKVAVNKDARNYAPDDPNHGFDDTTEEIFGFNKTVNETATPAMSGFAQNAAESGHDVSNPLSMFTSDEDSAPIINVLAKEFVVFDKWYCSLPGPTDPNRAFAMSGTSNGATTNYNGTHWNQQSYFDFLTQRDVTWRAYYQDDMWAIFYFRDTHYPRNSKNIFELDQFFTDVENGDLPSFTFLQPRMTPSIHGFPTWQHPVSPLREGERLYKKIYEALRGSSLWNSTAFLITYDEHGGFYDHVGPPQDGVPSPDGVVSPEGFQFDRLGVRVPTLLISPWVDAGVVEHAPTNGPNATSQYDATSVMATHSAMNGITEFLSERVAWAGTFQHLFNRTTPRTDCPETLPPVKPSPPWQHEELRQRPLEEHQRIQVEFYCAKNGHGEGCAERYDRQGVAGDFIALEARKYMQRVLQRGDVWES